MAEKLPYFTISEEHSRRFCDLIGNVRGMKIGIALDDGNRKPLANISDFLRNLPRHKLNYTYFYLMSSHETSLDSYLLGPHLVNMTEFMTDQQSITALIACLDCVITCDNGIAHMAYDMGKKVWLLVSDASTGDQTPTKYSNHDNVIIFRKRPDESWIHVFLRVSLHRLLHCDEFQVFSLDEQLIAQDIRLLASKIEIRDTDSLTALVDAQTPSFVNVMIETTTACNLKCSYCPNSTVGRPAEFMDEKMFFRIVDSIAEYDSNYNGRISPHFFGEPLLDARLETFVQYVRFKLPVSHIELFTNGELLTVTRYLSLKEAGVTTFIVSQHTPEPSPIITETMKTIQRDYAHLYGITYVDHFHSTEKMNRGGMIEPTGPIKLPIRCNSFMELIFDVHGNAVLCCNDYLSSQPFGNIRTKNIREIWDGSAYRRARNLLAYSYFPFAICGKCMKYVPT